MNWATSCLCSRVVLQDAPEGRSSNLSWAGTGRLSSRSWEGRGPPGRDLSCRLCQTPPDDDQRRGSPAMPSSFRPPRRDEPQAWAWERVQASVDALRRRGWRCSRTTSTRASVTSRCQATRTGSGSISCSRCHAWSQVGTSLAGSGGLNRNPWARSQPWRRKKSSCRGVSMPSATTSKLRLCDMAMIAVTIASSPASQPMSRMNDPSTFNRSSGKRFR